MAKRRRAARSSWGPVIAIGAALGTIGVVAFAVRASAKSAAPAAKPTPILPPFVPAPSPTPGGPSPADIFAAVATDPGVVKAAQTIVAQGLMDPTLQTATGLTSADYNQYDVDGNPNNPRWVRVLGVVQKYFNAILPTATPGKLPAGFPAQLRTDGVLDYATSTILDKA